MYSWHSVLAWKMVSEECTYIHLTVCRPCRFPERMGGNAVGERDELRVNDSAIFRTVWIGNVSFSVDVNGFVNACIIMMIIRDREFESP